MCNTELVDMIRSTQLRNSERERKKGKWDEEFLKENESQRKTEK